jgi:hypothetical protein
MIYPGPTERNRIIQTRKKKLYSFYVIHAIGLQHTLLSSCCPQKVDALAVKIQNSQAFRFCQMNHSSQIIARAKD